MPDDEVARLESLLRGERLSERFDLAALIARQQTYSLEQLLALAEGIWPEDESVDEFLTTREIWRQESLSDQRYDL